MLHVESPYLSFCPWLLRKKFTSTFHVCALEPCFYYKKATHLIAISRETKDYAMKHFGYAEKDITIINHGVSPKFEALASEEQRSAIRKKYGIPAGKIHIGLVGSIERRKGHDILLKALSTLSESILDEIQVIFCGSSKSGNTMDWLDRNVRSTIGWERVTHIEYTDSKEIYDMLDIFVLPSRLEGFPLVTLEAMLSNNCVVRSNTEGAYEQIIDEETGYLFENENSEQLASILHYLISHPEQRKETARKGREYALQHFTAKTMAEKTVSVYKKIINEY